MSQLQNSISAQIRAFTARTGSHRKLPTLNRVCQFALSASRQQNHRICARKRVLQLALVRKKRPFILLEILLALTLVSLCAIPLIVKPVQAYRFEMKALEEVEGERLADWTFSEIKEEMLQHKIPWEKLPSLNETAGPFPLDPGSIQVPGRQPKQIKRSFTIFGKGEKQGIAGQTYRMLYVKIAFDPVLSKKKKIYTYRLPVQRIGSA